MATSPMPRCAVVVVAENVLATSAEESVLAMLPESHPWHRIARDGCCAQLVLEVDPATPIGMTTLELRTAGLVRQLASLRAARTGALDAAVLKQRFPDLRVVLLSTSIAAVIAGLSLGWSAALLGPETTWPDHAAAMVADSTLVFVHARASTASDRRGVIDALGAVVDACHLPRVERIVVASHPAPTVSDDPASAFLMPSADRGGWPYARLDALRAPQPGLPYTPQQSFAVINGEPVATERLPLLAAYLLDGHSRRDAVDAFTEAAIGRGAGLGAISAQHFLPEIAYWLGCANKYGA